jgi:hypothetical protein
VTAVDDAPARLDRLRENLARLGLDAEVVAADVTTWAPGRTFDAVILDAPCTATGTISRHPDILRLKGPADVGRMAKVQAAMLANAAALVRPGGVLVYSTCSLEPEEGRAQVDGLLAREPAFRHVPIEASDIGAEAGWIAAGDVRTLPFHLGEVGRHRQVHISRLRRHRCQPLSSLPTASAPASRREGTRRLSGTLEHLCLRALPQSARAPAFPLALPAPSMRRVLGSANAARRGGMRRGALARMRRSP